MAHRTPGRISASPRRPAAPRRRPPRCGRARRSRRRRPAPGARRSAGRPPVTLEPLARDLVEEAARLGQPALAEDLPALRPRSGAAAPSPASCPRSRAGAPPRAPPARLRLREWGTSPSSSPTRKTASNSRPLAECSVMSTHRRVVLDLVGVRQERRRGRGSRPASAPRRAPRSRRPRRAARPGSPAGPGSPGCPPGPAPPSSR